MALKIGVRGVRLPQEGCVQARCHPSLRTSACYVLSGTLSAHRMIDGLPFCRKYGNVSPKTVFESRASNFDSILLQVLPQKGPAESPHGKHARDQSATSERRAVRCLELEPERQLHGLRAAEAGVVKMLKSRRSTAT